MTNSRCDPRSISAHYEYDPFGNGIITTGTFSTENNFRFSSKWFDVDGKLYYYGHRYYNSSLGRWINRDKIDDKANIALLDNALDLSIYGENFYSFSGNEPLLK
ncbi:MAG: RHS repeat-associated core domain-containing protein, partial [bacterium]